MSHESASSESLPFDHPAFLRQLHGDAALASAMAALFLTECPRQLDGVRQAVQANDAKQLVQTAHRLKGSVGNFAATEATAAAARLEALGQSGDLSPARDALRALEAALERLTSALREIAA